MTMSISALLQNTLSPSQPVRADAEAQLLQLSSADFPQYLALLSNELGNETSAEHVRRSAGLMFKNAISAKDFERQIEVGLRWISVDANIRAGLKHQTINVLATPHPHIAVVAAQVIAAIANIEVARGEWPDLVPALLANVQSQSDSLKTSALQCIGFICELLDPLILETQSNAILTAVAQGAKKDQQNEQVRLAAMHALYNSLEFIRGNFDREVERNYVMQIVCEGTQSSNADVQIISFECLVKIMSLYYDKMGMYMEKALYGLTLLGMRHDNEKVVLQAIEFWSSIFEMEAEMTYDNSVREEGEDHDLVHNFAFSVVAEITPVLLYLMAKKDEDEDDDMDEWNISMSAATCLQLLASCTGGTVVPFVLPFIESNIKNPDWKFREAAVMAFGIQALIIGSIIDGPEPADISSLVSMALPTLIELMNDPVVHIKDTAAWTLGRICENMFQTLQENEVQAVIQAIVRGLDDTPRVASNCAWCIINLSEQTAGLEDQKTGPLDRYFTHILGELTRVAERFAFIYVRPNQDSNFRAASYEAISTLVAHGSHDSLPYISTLATQVVERLNQTVAIQNQIVGSDEMREHYLHQANLCCVLTCIIRRLGSGIKEIADPIMQTLLSVIQNASKNSTVMEDAFLAIGALTTAIESSFIRYMEMFVPILVAALNNFDEHQMCIIAIGVVGDICRALNDQISYFTEVLVNSLGMLLTHPNVHRDIKPVCLSCIGDIALAAGGAFEGYVTPVCAAISQIQIENPAATTSPTSEQYEYICSMREAIAESYVGIAQALKSAEKGAVLLPFVNQIFRFIETCSGDSERGDDVTRSIVGLFGDLAECLPETPSLKGMFGMPTIELLVNDARKNGDVRTREVAKWAKEMVRRRV